MRPVSVEFQAFGPYVGEEHVDFDRLSTQGLFLICGKTGSGKTTLLDAMTFALFGKCSGHGRDDLRDMRCTGAPDELPTYVRFVFEHQGSRYLFERIYQKKRTSFTVSCRMDRWVEETWEPMDENPKETTLNKRAEELIGLTYAQFQQVIILPQGQFEKLLTSSSTEKEEILTKLFGGEEWSRITDRFFEEAIRTEKEWKDKQVRILQSLEEEGCQSTEELADRIEKRRKELQEAQEAYKKENYEKQSENLEEQLRLIEKYREIEEDYAGRVRALELAKYDVEECEKKHKIVQEKIALYKEKESEIEKLEKQKVRYEDRVDEYRDIDEVEKNYNVKNRECSSAEKAEKKQLESIQNKKEEISRYVEELQSAKTDYERLMDRYLSGVVGELRDNLKEGESCPVCGAVYHADKAHACIAPSDDEEAVDGRIRREDLDKQKQKLDEMDSRIKDETEQCEKLTTELDDLKRKTAQIREELAGISAQLDTMKKNRIPGIDSLGELETEIRSMEKQITDYREEKAQLAEQEKDAHTAYNNAVTKEKVAAEEINTAKTKLEKAKATLPEDTDACLERKKEIDEAVKKHTKDVAILEENIREMTEKHERLTSESEGIEEALLQAEKDVAVAKQIRGDTGLGLKRYVLGVMFSSVVTAANEMLTKVHGGRYRLYRSDEKLKGEKKSGLNLKVHDRMSEEKEGRFVGTLSGGEKFLVSLALAIGMSTVAGRGGVRIEALFIDEGFGSLDEESIEDAMEILERVQKANGMVGIISHVGLLAERIPTKLIVSTGRSSNATGAVGSTLRESIG